MVDFYKHFKLNLLKNKTKYLKQLPQDGAWFLHESTTYIYQHISIPQVKNIYGLMIKIIMIMLLLVVFLLFPNDLLKVVN